MEIGEFLFQFPEVFQEESLAQSTCSIEEVHLSVCGVKGLSHMHDLCTQRCHTGSTTNPNHLFARSKVGMEVSIRTTHHHLVARFEAENIRRADTSGHIHETYLRTRQERCGSNTHGKGDDVSLCRIVGHRVCTHRRFRIMGLERKDIKLLPRTDIVLAYVLLVKILVIVDTVVGWNLDLGIRTRHKVHVFAGRKCHFELFDKAGHILVRNNGTLPLFHTHHALGNLDFQIALYLALASQTPMLLNLLACKMGAFRIEYLSTALKHLHFTLSAAGLTSTSRRQENTILVEGSHQTASLSHRDGLVAIDGNGHIAAGAQIFLCHKQNDDQQEYRHQENSYTN